ncbi:unnamed protein product [Rotaria sp. Silwood2]|nr:unnamed protein product [Rotaria sp. Silwood2]CAF4764074.1 unnamed protein product [Rotaria sp. Silwood2]
MPYGNFDLDELIHDIQHLPPDFHEDRLLATATRATATVINTCFRRGYVVNVLKYKIYAGVAAVVPLLDLLPRYFGREEIRQVFGVNSRSRFMNWWTGQADEFKDYLTQFQIVITEQGFKTSAFQKSFQYRGTATASKVSSGTSVVLKGVTTVGIAGLSVSDDFLRNAGVGVITVARGVSIGFIVAGVVVTAAMCAWSAVSNGKQMYDYLNRLCDDLIVVAAYVAKKIIEDNHRVRTTFSN